MTYEKKLGPGPKNLGRGTNFKMSDEICENGFLWKLRISEKSSGPNKIALARPIFERMTSNLLHLKGMSYIYVIVAQNGALYIVLGLQFWYKVKNSKFWDTLVFRRADFAGPGVGPEKIFGPENCFAVLHMSQLEFWYHLTPTFYPDSGDFRR